MHTSRARAVAKGCTQRAPARLPNGGVLFVHIMCVDNTLLLLLLQLVVALRLGVQIVVADDVSKHFMLTRNANTNVSEGLKHCLYDQPPGSFGFMSYVQHQQHISVRHSLITSSRPCAFLLARPACAWRSYNSANKQLHMCINVYCA